MKETFCNWACPPAAWTALTLPTAYPVIPAGSSTDRTGLPSASFPSDHAFVSAQIVELPGAPRVYQWNAGWIADSWAEFELNGTAADFNRFFLDQMDNYFSSVFEDTTHYTRDTPPAEGSSTFVPPNSWLTFYALAAICGGRDQLFPRRTFEVDVCKAGNKDQMKTSIGILPDVTEAGKTDGKKGSKPNASDPMLMLYYGAHKYVVGKLLGDDQEATKAIGTLMEALQANVGQDVTTDLRADIQFDKNGPERIKNLTKVVQAGGIAGTLDTGKARKQFADLLNIGLVGSNTKLSKTTTIIGDMTKQGDIIGLQEGPLRADPTEGDPTWVEGDPTWVYPDHTLVHPGPNDTGPPVVYFRTNKYGFHREGLTKIAAKLGVAATGNHILWEGGDCKAKILIVPLQTTETQEPLTVVSFHASSKGAELWKEGTLKRLKDALEAVGSYVICADTNGKDNLGKKKGKGEDPSTFADIFEASFVPEGEVATVYKTRTIMQAQPQKAGDLDHSKKDIIAWRKI